MKRGGQVKTAIKLPVMALPAVMAFLLVTDDAAIAQAAGSIGGTLGKADKSVSGGGQEPPSTTHVRSAVHDKAASSRTKGHLPRNENGSLASYDGAWVGSSFGECIINGWSWKVQINGGNISGTNVTGRVSGGGGVNGAMTTFGVTYDFHGHLRSSQGSGKWVVRSGTKAGCVGTWTIVKS
jgi:hypothetical protein